ncbi:MAG: YchJ family protein, partial [Pseudobdellovibrio sp.]
MNCPCQSQSVYEECCKPFLDGIKKANTAEKLMRSRYTAYAMADIDYLKKTLAPESRSDFDPATTKKWAQSAKWKGLKILSTDKGLEGDVKGTVEFIATYEQDGEGLDHHEVSTFRKSENGEWF